MTDDSIEYGLDGNPLEAVFAKTIIKDLHLEDPATGNEEVETEIEPLVEVDIEEVPEEIEYPESELQHLNDARVALEHLVSLHYTISRRGVSRGDVDSVLKTRANLESKGFVLTPLVSIEAYGAQHYTDDRSGVNLTLAQESFKQTIVNVIRAILRKLMDFINRVVRFFRRHLMSEDRMELLLDKAVRRLEATIETNTRLENVYGVPGNYRELWTNHHDKLMSGKNFPMSRMAITMIGGSKQGRMEDLDAVFFDIPKAAAGIVAVTEELMSYLLDPELEDAQIDINRLRAISNVQVELDKFNIIEPNVKFTGTSDTAAYPLIRSVKANKDLTLVYTYQMYLDTYEQVNDHLKTANRTQGKEDIDGLADIVAALSQSIDDLGKVINAIVETNKLKVKIINTMYDLQNFRFTVLFNHARTTALDPAQMKILERHKERLAKLIKETLR